MYENAFENKKFPRMCKLTVSSCVDKNLLILFFVIFTCDVVRAKELVKDENGLENIVEIASTANEMKKKNYEKNYLENLYVQLTRQTLDKINRADSAKTLALLSRKIDKVDALIKQKTLTILNALDLDFQNLTNRITILENNLTDLTALIKQLSIVNQIGLVHTTAASSALTTNFLVSNGYSYEVERYNDAISVALHAVSIVLDSPSRNNIRVAQAALAIAIENFDMIDCLISVESCYSIAEVHAKLIELDAQLRYLYALQS